MDHNETLRNELTEAALETVVGGRREEAYSVTVDLTGFDGAVHVMVYVEGELVRNEYIDSLVGSYTYKFHSKTPQYVRIKCNGTVVFNELVG